MWLAWLWVLIDQHWFGAKVNMKSWARRSMIWGCFSCLVANRYGTWKLRMWKSTIIETSFHCKGLITCLLTCICQVCSFGWSSNGWLNFGLDVCLQHSSQPLCELPGATPDHDNDDNEDEEDVIKSRISPRPNKPIATLMPPLQTRLSHLPLSRKIYVYIHSSYISPRMLSSTIGRKFTPLSANAKDVSGMKFLQICDAGSSTGSWRRRGSLLPGQYLDVKDMNLLTRGVSCMPGGMFCQ